MVINNGIVHPRGDPAAGLSILELAAHASPGPGKQLPDEVAPEFLSTEYFVPPAVTIGSGTHIAVVEVDVGTGQVRVLDYVAVHDCGTVLNPMVVEGQHHGGIAHGLGNALLEEALYDDAANPITATFMDYLLPTAMDVPPMRIVHRPHPSPLNPMGIKGAGEGATASAPAAIANAVADALLPRRIGINQIPITPARLVELIDGAQ
jgi:carbon-monoxide dehydrogenase large subunit